MTADVLALRRSPLHGTGFGLAAPGLTMAEEPFRSLVEVRSPAAPAGELVWRLGPDWWLVDGPPAPVVALEVPLAGELRAAGGVATDVSAHRTTLVLTGPHAATLIAHGCPIDLSIVPVGGCVQGTLAGAQVALGRTGPDSLRVYVRAAFARHLATWLSDAATPYVE
ncbi:sarcosine oxidase subunit gamma [Nocardioides lianchengensis]|uniref:Sarcosine oxidase subunit gamma n=1 Tax=Nocardioides lianchengensis TaxID=1045774 RepID=A0A1G6Y554_9ACTN|nr:sarcosine oxidase subunit gamma family protein [Nocardioides lianchengensis]NYG13546.1 sarcosine oxidase subunit gamma [Nocardioides lianchengensis]SDD85103.1 sarcosine oxidase subunit gamma [Nocardioides lianchengensis]